MTEQYKKYCPHCGNVSMQEHVGYTTDYGNPDGAHHYIFTKCPTCRRGLVYKYVDHGNRQFSWLNSDLFYLLYPKSHALHDAVPTSVREIYAEASIIKKAPNAFANQIRCALEALCIDRGAPKHNLAQNLTYLAEKGEIPQGLAEMTDILRKLGNLGSHATGERVDPDYVDVIDEFFRVVVEYVYVAPYKLKKFVSHLEEVKKSKTEDQ